MSSLISHSKILTLSSLALLLTACGGGGSDDNNLSGGNTGGNNNVIEQPNIVVPPENPDLFTKKGELWRISPEANQDYCYNIEQARELMSCEDNDWDLKFSMGTRSPLLFTNSGVSGPGQGGALYSPLHATWDKLSLETDATQGGKIPANAWVTDSYNNAFMNTDSGFNSFFEYNLFGKHQMSPNFKTFLVTTNKTSGKIVGTDESPVFALQIINYYQGTSSGYITLRYINTASPSDIKQVTIDASKGWSYIDLATGNVSTDRNTTWQLGFNRYNVELHQNAGSYIAGQPIGFYNEKGTVNLEKFEDRKATDKTMSDLLAAATLADIPVRAWGGNSISSILNPVYQGAYPDKMSFGWYDYYPTIEAAEKDGLKASHILAATPTQATIIRSNTGKSYARLRLKEIEYQDPTNSASQSTWTFEFDIQPAS